MTLVAYPSTIDFRCKWALWWSDWDQPKMVTEIIKKEVIAMDKNEENDNIKTI